MTRTRAALAAIAMSAASLPLSGCLATGLLPEPDPPTPSLPSMPDAANARTSAGAEAFVRHYFAVEDYALQSGDVAALQVLASDSCRECTRVAFVIRAADQVGRMEGGDRAIDTVRQVPSATGADWSGRVAGETASSVLRADKGDDLRYAGGPFSKAIDLTWTDGGWVVTGELSLG